ncbi:Cobyrinic acid a,c-diamide synthetase [hydrothermal vent metagenome]|uniref:Cobyrinic acid a,c-diamide synthetase n=1 Tax=hydrothermal vent metagenome TaxID=652676 RepID=A0A3B1DBE7_9ZZZZ
MKGFLIGAAHSGAGKTTVSAGVMAALIKKGLSVQPFKVGPDFIDPGLHGLVSGSKSYNLDIWMAGGDYVKALFAEKCADRDVAVVEGVMGLFDGGVSSSAAVSEVLGLPVILIVDARSMAESAGAVVRGFRDFQQGLRLAGVIFNRVASRRHRELIMRGMESVTGVEIIGFLPSEEAIAIPQRHLGLYTADEIPLKQSEIERLAAFIEENLDLDKLLTLTDYKRPETDRWNVEVKKRLDSMRIAIARDRAFSFYYEDFLETLRVQGAELVFFSPLSDKALPEEVNILYLGGGYPELYAESLSGNSSMRKAVRRWCLSGGSTYAECGGFMYLTEGIRDFEDNFYPMAGVFPTKATMRKKRMRLGYREIVLSEDSIAGEKGARVRGHEFHYSDIDPMPENIKRIYRAAHPPGIECGGYRYMNTVGSYVHLYLGGRGFCSG